MKSIIGEPGMVVAFRKGWEKNLSDSGVFYIPGERVIHFRCFGKNFNAQEGTVSISWNGDRVEDLIAEDWEVARLTDVERPKPDNRCSGVQGLHGVSE